MPDTLGYARVSTDEQDLAGQVLRLKAAGAARTYEDVISGRTFDRPGLKALLDYARAGDTLAVVRRMQVALVAEIGRAGRQLVVPRGPCLAGPAFARPGCTRAGAAVASGRRRQAAAPVKVGGE